MNQSIVRLGNPSNFNSLLHLESVEPDQTNPIANHYTKDTSYFTSAKSSYHRREDTHNQHKYIRNPGIEAVTSCHKSPPQHH